jgi:hypothetical protein
MSVFSFWCFLVLHGWPSFRALTGRENHHHLTAFHLRILFQLGEDFGVFLHAGQEVHAQMLVGHFASAEAQSDLDLVAIVEEALHCLHLYIVIVIVDGRAHLDLFDLNDLLLLAGLGGLLLLFVLVFSEVHQLADGWLVVWRYLHDVETFFLGQGASLVDADLAILVAVFPDQKDGTSGDLFIDARAILGGCLLVLLETSGYYDSLLWLRPRNSLRSREGLGLPRETDFDHGRGLGLSWPLNVGRAGRLRRRV